MIQSMHHEATEDKRISNKSWWTQEIDELIKQKQLAYKKFITSKNKRKTNIMMTSKDVHEEQ